MASFEQHLNDIVNEYYEREFLARTGTIAEFATILAGFNYRPRVASRILRSRKTLPRSLVACPPEELSSE